MTNYERYKKDIKKFTRLGIAVAMEKDTNKIVACKDIHCDVCLFHYDYCADEKLQWANEEYKEPGIDWSKVPVDTKILVKDNFENDWLPRYFAKYYNGIVYAWVDGKTSFSAEDEEIMYWNHVKLA